MTPFVRHMLLCDAVRTDANRRLVIEGLHATRFVKNGQLFPVWTHVCAFTMLAAIHSAGMIHITVTEASTSLEVARSNKYPVAARQDPLEAIGFVIDIPMFQAPIAGNYWVDLWYDGVMIAHQMLQIKETS